MIMLVSDFQYIKYFTKQEIENAGGIVDGIDYDLIHNIDRVRTMFGKPLHICYNGINSGDHSSKRHKNGQAIDVYVSDLTQEDAVKLCLIASSTGYFKEIGCYLGRHNVYSFHFAYGDYIKTWFGRKYDSNEWTYKSLKFDEE